jgi:hypothetical protein
LGLGFWVWGPIPNPQSPIPNPQYYLNMFININFENIFNLINY